MAGGAVAFSSRQFRADPCKQRITDLADLAEDRQPMQSGQPAEPRHAFPHADQCIEADQHLAGDLIANVHLPMHEDLINAVSRRIERGIGYVDVGQRTIRDAALKERNLP